jgi:hypothetical protein
MPPKPRRRSDLLQVQVEITEEQLDTLISDRPWSPLPADLETVVTQLPQTEPRCVRSTVLAWAHRHQGLIGYSQVHGALTGYRDLRAARKHAASILNLMSKQRLLSRVHFAADAPTSCTIFPVSSCVTPQAAAALDSAWSTASLAWREAAALRQMHFSAP